MNRIARISRVKWHTEVKFNQGAMFCLYWTSTQVVMDSFWFIVILFVLFLYRLSNPVSTGSIQAYTRCTAMTFPAWHDSDGQTNHPKLKLEF